MYFLKLKNVVRLVLPVIMVSTSFAQEQLPTQNTYEPNPKFFTPAKSLQETQPHYLAPPFAQFLTEAAVDSAAVNPANLDDKKIKFQAYCLTVDESARNEIQTLIGKENFKSTVGAAITTKQLDELSQFGKELEGDVAVGKQLDTKDQTAASFGTIGDDKLLAIKKIIKSHSDCEITILPATYAFEGKPSTLFDGALVPYVGHVYPEVSADDVKQRVAYQLIEDGVILQQKAKLNGQVIELSGKAISNEIIDVESFTFSGSSKEGVTVQIPLCKCSQAAWQASLKPGTMLFVDPEFTKTAGEKVAGERFAGVIEKKKAAESQKLKRLYVFAATIESQQ